jgi:hypothetical protein
MEERFGYDFSRVRVHADAPAAASAQAVGATAYAVGQHVAFAQHAYAPDTESGDKLLAHELAHVVQQNTASLPPTGALKLPTGSSAEREADALAARAIHAERLSPPAGRPLSALARGSSRRASGGRVGARAEARTGAIVERGPEAQVSLSTSFVAPGTVQRQLITPLGPGGGYRGVMSRDQAFNRRLMATPYRVCSRPLQVGGFIANHAYIEAPPYRYAVIGPAVHRLTAVQTTSSLVEVPPVNGTIPRIHAINLRSTACHASQHPASPMSGSACGTRTTPTTARIATWRSDRTATRLPER